MAPFYTVGVKGQRCSHGGAMASVTPVNTVTMASFDLIIQAKAPSHTEILDIGSGCVQKFDMGIISRI